MTEPPAKPNSVQTDSVEPNSAGANVKLRRLAVAFAATLALDERPLRGAEPAPSPS